MRVVNTRRVFISCWLQLDAGVARTGGAGAQEASQRRAALSQTPPSHHQMTLGRHRLGHPAPERCRCGR
jgi:hypothetical protein